MGLRELNQRKKKRGLKWELYKTNSGRIPKELLSLFVDILRRVTPELLPSKPPISQLNDAETEVLRRTLNFIERFGLDPNASDETSNDTEITVSLKPPIFEKVKGKSYREIFEFKISNTANNPRFLACKREPNRLVFLHGFKKKTRQLSNEDKDVALKRLKDLKNREGG